MVVAGAHGVSGGVTPWLMAWHARMRGPKPADE